MAATAAAPPSFAKKSRRSSFIFASPPNCSAPAADDTAGSACRQRFERFRSKPLPNGRRQQLLVSPAQIQSPTITQHQLVVAMEHGAQLGDEPDPHDV